MSNESLNAAERLIADNFLSLLPIARCEGITIKRMSHLLIQTMIRALDREVANRFELMAESGYSRRGVRLLLAEEYNKHREGTLGCFMNQWTEDPKFPDELPIEARRGPSFDRLHQRYGRDYTRPGLLKVLKNHGLVEVKDSKVRMLRRAVTVGTPVKRLENGRHAVLALLHTIYRNLSGGKSTLLQENLRSRAIPADKIAEVRGKIQDVLKPAQEQINKILAAYALPAKKNTADERSAAEIGLGLYWYEIEDPQTVFDKPAGYTKRREGRTRKAASRA